VKIKKILLIHPMHEKKEKTERESFNFPFGIAYIARVVMDAGYDVEVLDAHALQWEKEQVIGYLRGKTWDAVGISAFSTQYNAVRFFSDFIKNEKNIPIIVGGPCATFSWELTLSSTKADFCVIAEGDLTILDLLNNLHSPEKVAGIAFRNERGQVFVTSPRPHIKYLDTLPRPAYELFDMEKYVKHKMSIGRKKQPMDTRVMTFITNRGCPFRCRFCSRTFSGFRSLSAQKIIEEIEYLAKKYSLNGIAFNDELFVCDKKKISVVAPYLKKRGLFWSGQARVNLVDYPLLKMMKDNRCIGVGYGIESGSQKILDNMDKGITVLQIERAMRETMRLGLDIKVQLIFGYPGEDEQTVSETIDLFRRIGHPGRRFNVITPLPGSPLYDETIKNGMIKDEAAFLAGIEKSFGWGKVYVNYTAWPDEEIYPRKYAAEEKMRRNYLKQHPVLLTKELMGSLKRRIILTPKNNISN
jgi:radical SAM superfamily enzyme YgiQ (UPF0313 family)